MKFSFIINYAMHLFQKQFSETMKIIILSSVICIIVFLGITTEFFIRNEIRRLSDKIEIVLLTEPQMSDIKLNQQINVLKNEPELSNIKFITNQNAIRNFASKYGYIAEDLINTDEIPHILICKIKDLFQTHYQFHLLISKIKTKYQFKKILYREDLIYSILDFKRNILLSAGIIGSAILLLLFISMYIVYKTPLIKNSEDAKTLSILGAGKLIYSGSIAIFILLASTFGVAFGIALTLAFWQLTYMNFLWLKIDITKIIINTFLISLILNILVVLFVLFFKKINLK